jgi:hypothetical protein
MKKTANTSKFLRALICFLIIGSPVYLFGQNYSGLQNKELMPDLSKESVIGGLLEVLTTGDLSGNITNVKVLDDQDVSLTVSVAFIGFHEGYVHFSLTDEELKPLKGFTAQIVSIVKDKKEVEARIQLDPKSYGENESFVAPRLLLLVSKTESGTNGVRRIYKLDKKFTNPISPDNIIIPVALTPVGSAASLPQTMPTEAPNGGSGLVIPKRNVYEVIKDKPTYLYKASPVVEQPGRVVARPVETERTLVKSKVAAVSVLHAAPIYATVHTESSPAPSTDAQGPANKPLSFWGDFIYSDVDFESQMKITSVNLNIYPDKNPNSGVFYYLPIAYDIKYDKEKGFAFNVDYGTSRGEGSESKVRMSGTLSSGISLYEVQFIKNLMDAYKKQNPGLKLDKPLPLPVSETPTITIGDELKNFGITSVNINNVSSITDAIEFSWQTDGTTAAELENLLRVNSGITGKMKIKTTSADLPVQEIPVRIRLIDENTFGRFGMTPTEMRTKNWRNETPFPVKLKYVHYMIIDKNKDGKESPIIYSWDLNNQEIQPRAQVKFDVSTVPTWLDNYKGKTARIWLDYSVTNSCSTCNEKVFSKIVSSTNRPQLSNVVFRVIDFFEEYNIAYLDIEMKSVQGDPNGRTETTFPAVHITKDKADYTAGKIYIPTGSTPIFDYRITVVTNNGQELHSDWIKRNSLNVPFGSFQLEELFPSLKK